MKYGVNLWLSIKNCLVTCCAILIEYGRYIIRYEAKWNFCISNFKLYKMDRIFERLGQMLAEFLQELPSNINALERDLTGPPN